MRQFNIPTIVRINDQITINLNQTVSHSIDRQSDKRLLKKEIEAAAKEGTLKRAYREDDYDVIGKVDKVSFWFLDNQGVTFEVGTHMDQASFERVAAIIDEISYRLKSERE